MNLFYTIRIKIVWISTKTTPCTNAYYTICITIVWIGTKTTPCTNSYYTICRKQRYSLKSDSMKLPTCTILYEKILPTIHKSGLYDLTRMAFSQPLISKNFWFTIHVDSWFWRIIDPICWACAIFRWIPNLQACTDGWINPGWAGQPSVPPGKNFSFQEIELAEIYPTIWVD